MNNPNFPNMMPGNQQANRQQTIQQLLLKHYRQAQEKAPPGWQQQITPEERGGLALQFFTSYRLLKPDAHENDVLRQSLQFETASFMQSQTKEQYSTTLRQKLFTMQSLRQQQLQGLNPQANNPMNAMNQMNAAQMGMMGQANPQNPTQNTPQQVAQGFPNPQLRQQMQPTAIPMSQSQSTMGAQGGNMGNPAQAPNNPQPNLQQGQQTPQQQQGLIIGRLTQRLMDQARPEIRQQFQNEVNNWPEDKKQQLLSRGINPLLFRFRQQAENMLKNGKISRELLLQLQNQGQPNQAGGGMQQGQMANQQMNANQRQSGQFDFNALANQQSEAMRVQDQGQQVVPASNNNSNVGAQMGNFPPGQQQNAAMAQRQAAQAAAFQNANANLQRQAAQAQAEARARQAMQQQNLQQQMGTPNLHGQPGGLNRPLGTPNPNAAMSMLNRPMVPPGQPNPTTPQQRPQAHVPQMTPQSQGQVDPSQITQLMREAQQRAQQAAGVQGQPLTEQNRMQMIPPELDPMVKQQLLKVPEPQFRHILGQYLASARSRGMNIGTFPGGQPPNGQPNMMMNPGQNMPMGGMANGLMNGQNMGSMRPGGLGQPMPGAMGGQQMPMGQRPGQLPHQARLLHAQQTLQQNPGIISMTDNRIFPPSALNAQIRQILPPEVKTWAQLKSWTQQNPNLTPGVDSQKLLLLQVLHFQDLMKQSQQNGMPGQRPQQPPNNMGPIAPPAQMTPGAVPNRPPQQQPNMANLGPVQVTPQEIQAWRQRLPPQQANATDEQLRNFIMQQKINVRRQQQATMLNMQNQQRNQGQPQAMMAGQGPQATRPPSAQTQPAQATPHTKPAGQPAPPTQPSAQANMNKGMKRPNEDGAEAGGDGQPANAAPQAPAMVPSRSQQGVNLTQEQMSKMGPQQAAQMRANLMKAQDASNKQSQGQRLPSQEELAAKLKEPERERKFKLMIQQEEGRLPKAHTQQISPDVRASLQQLIKEKLPHVKKVEQALRIFLISYESPESENLARTVIRARILLLRQLNPADGTLHPELTLTESEFQMNIRHILSFVGKVMSRMANQQAQAKPGQQNQQQPQRDQVTPQLNAANLKIVEQQQRQQKAPPAPTASQPPFQLGGASPQGAPKYFEGAKPLTHLSLPEKKRQKMDPNSQTSTPASKQSPRISSSKGNSPELKRQAPPAAQKPTFKCRFSDCEYSMRGFDTQAELDTHVNHIHTKIDDPVQFALEAMAEYVDVDPKTGQPKQDPTAAARGTKPASSAPRVPPQPIKAGHTPGMPQSAATPVGLAAATPMTRVPTQTGIKGSPSTNLLKTPQTSIKVATPSTGAPGKPTPASITKTAHKESDAQPKVEPALEEDAPPLVPVSLFDFSYDDIYSVLDTNGPLTTLDLKDEDNSWALRSRPSSPLDTPDSTSKDTPSTRQSDISENDNLQINLDIKDADMPEAWLNMTGDALPLHLMLSQDLEALGVGLPAMDNDDMMPFHPDSMMMDLDSIDKAMDSMGGMPGISV